MRDREWGSFTIETAAQNATMNSALGNISLKPGGINPGVLWPHGGLTSQQIDTEQLRDTAFLLSKTALAYEFMEITLSVYRSEISLLWAHVSSPANIAVNVLDAALGHIRSAREEAADYAGKLLAAAASYESAEVLASQVMKAYESVYGQSLRRAFTSGNPAGIALGLSATVGFFILDSRTRGIGIAMRSLSSAVGIDYRTLSLGLSAARRTLRERGIGVVKLQGFRESQMPEELMRRATQKPLTASAAGLVGQLQIAQYADSSLDRAENPDDDVVATAHIVVTEVTGLDGATSYVVSIPGSDFGNMDSLTEPDGGFSILEHLPDDPRTPLTQSSALMQMVDQALDSAGAGPQDAVLIAGFSQGGMAAMSLAGNREFTAKHRLKGVMTIGSPTQMYANVPEAVKVLNIQDNNDLVTGFQQEGEAPGNPQAVVVDYNGAQPVVETHSTKNYLGAAQRIDEHWADIDGGNAYHGMLREVIPDGATSRTRVYQSTSEVYVAGAPMGKAVERTLDVVAGGLTTTRTTAHPAGAMSRIPSLALTH